MLWLLGGPGVVAVAGEDPGEADEPVRQVPVGGEEQEVDPLVLGDGPVPVRVGALHHLLHLLQGRRSKEVMDIVQPGGSAAGGLA